jgi:DNA mismatch repair endonuclease MutH
VALPLDPDPSFDYRTANKEAILARASLLEGRVLGDIAGASFTVMEAKRGKGEVGAAIEHFFGIPPNSRQEADFPGAEIELKVVPLRRTGRGVRVKERTVISMIDFHGLVLESWGSASVRKKLKILFVFFEHLVDVSKSSFPIQGILYWEPDASTDGFIKADWERVLKKVRHGLAHELRKRRPHTGPLHEGYGFERPQVPAIQRRSGTIAGVRVEAFVHPRPVQPHRSIDT